MASTSKMTGGRIHDIIFIKKNSIGHAGRSRLPRSVTVMDAVAFFSTLFAGDKVRAVFATYFNQVQMLFLKAGKFSLRETMNEHGHVSERGTRVGGPCP